VTTSLCSRRQCHSPRSLHTVVDLSAATTPLLLQTTPVILPLRLSRSPAASATVQALRLRGSLLSIRLVETLLSSWSHPVNSELSNKHPKQGHQQPSTAFQTEFLWDDPRATRPKSSPQGTTIPL
jgi:hypothetical protein